MRWTLRRRAIVVLAMSTMLVTLACGKSGSSSGSSGGSNVKSSDGARATGSVTGLKYAPNVTVMEQRDGIAALKSISSDGSLLLFRGNSTVIAALKPGSVIMIKGVLARKVLAVEEDDGDIGVLTEPAGITDVIEEGRLQFNYPVRFAPGVVVNTALAAAPASNPFVRTAYASDAPTGADAPSAKSTQFEVKDWKVEVTAIPEADKINLKVRATREGNGFSAVVIGDGYLQNFDAGGDIEITRGRIEQVQMINKKLNGTMNFKWSVNLEVAERPFQSVKIDIPVMVNVPLAPLLGGMPLFLVVDGAVLIKPAFGGKEELSYGEIRITYDGTQRFRIKEGNVDPEGQVSGTVELVKWDNVAKLAPTGMNVAFAAPRIELTFGFSKALKSIGDFDDPAKKADALFDKLGRKVFGNDVMDKLPDVKISKALDMVKGNEASAWFELITSSGTSAGVLDWGACQQTDIYISAGVGANAKLLGESAGEAKKQLWKKHIHASKPPGKTCA